MKIAVSCDGLDVARRFDFAESLTCYTIDRGIICRCQTMPHPHDSAAKIADLFVGIGIDVLICGLIHADDARVFCKKGVEVVAGAAGPARDASDAYLTRTFLGADEVCDLDEDDVTCCLI